MAEDTTIGLKIVAETDSFDMALKKTKDNIKQLGANFKESVASLDRWSQSSDGLTKKIDSLNGEMSQYKAQMDATKKEIEKLSKNEEANATAIANKKKILQEANTKYKEAKQSVGYYTAELEKAKQKEAEEKTSLGQLTDAIAKQEIELAQLGKQYKNAVLTYGKNSKEAKNLAKQIKSTSKELNDNKKEAKDADKALSDLGHSAQTSGDHLLSFEKIGHKLGSALKKVGLGTTALVTGFFASASATRELRDNLAKLDTAFTTNGHSVSDATKTYETLYGVLGDSDQATETANLLASLTDNEKDLKNWTDILTGVYATFGDSLPIEGLAEASNETAKTGKITGSLADALNWAGISEDKFQKSLDKCNNESERQELIQKTLAKTYGEASTKYKETNKDVIASQEAQAKLSEKMAEVGAIAEPLMTTFKELGTQILDAVVPVAEEWIPKIQEGLQWVIDNKDTLIAGVAGLGVALASLNVANMIFGVVKAFKAFKTAQEGATLAQWLLNIAMDANPIGIIIALIAGLVTAFVVLWNKSEAFRNFWKGLWEDIKDVTGKVLSAIGNFFSDAWDDAKHAWSFAKSWFSNLMQKIVEVIKNQISKVKGFFSNAWSGAQKAWSTAKSWFSNLVQSIVDGFKTRLAKIKEFFSNAWDNAQDAWNTAKSWFANTAQSIVSTFVDLPSRIKNFFSNAWDNAKDAWSNVKSFFTGKLDDITDAFSNLPSKMGEIGKNMIEGLWNGIGNAKDWIISKLDGFGASVLQGIKDFFRIKSPSRVMRDEVGANIAKGIAVGIEKETKTVTNAMNKVGDKAFASAKKITDKIQAQYDTIKDNQKSMKDRLAGTGDLFSIDSETGKVTLNNLKDETQQINKFAGNLVQLKKKLPKGMMLELSGLDAEEGLKVTDAIKKMSKKELDAYVSAYNARAKASDNASKQYYADEVKSVKKNFNDKVSDVMKALPSKLKSIGVQTMAGFGKGMNSTKKAMSKTISSISKDIIGQFKKDLKIHSPSKLAEDEIGYNVSAGIAEGVISGGEEARTAVDDLVDDLFSPDLPEEPKVLSFWDKLADRILAVRDKLSDWTSSITGQVFSEISKGFDLVSGSIKNVTGAINGYYNQIYDNQQDLIDREIEANGAKYDALIEQQENATQQQLDILSKQRDQGIITNEQYRARREQIEDALAKYTDEKNAQSAKKERELLAQKDAIARKQFEAQQRNSIAQALIDGASAMIKNFAQYGFKIGGALNLAQGMATSAQIATIRAQQYVPLLAKGGIADRATLAVIGESGKEAVMPLEKNTGWMTELAEKLSAIMQKDFIGGVSEQNGTILNTNNNSTVNNFTQVINAPKTPSRRELYRDSKNLLALKGI